MGDHCTDLLSEYLDGDLASDERAGCEAHLVECAACRTALAEIEAVVLAARQAPGLIPPSDLWPGVAARLEVRPAAPTSAGSWRSRQVTLSLSQLALAASLLIALSSGAAWVAMQPRAVPAEQIESAIRAVPEAPGSTAAGMQPINFADADFDAAVSDLERILAEHRSRLDPRTVRVLERNLQAIDEAVTQARQALQTDPANPYLNSHLVDARQSKLDLLRHAVLLAAEGS